MKDASERPASPARASSTSGVEAARPQAERVERDRLGLLRDRAVRSALSLALGRAVEHHERIGSTQDRARQLAESGSIALVVAEEQTGGRGRHGRSWAAPAATSLLASWTFRPLPSDPALFGLLAGVAVARALDALGVEGARLKWPNDVQLSGRKVAGVLADAITNARGGALILGIGVNVHQTAAQLGDLAASATSVAIEAAPVDRLALLARIDAGLQEIAADTERRRAFLDEWRARSSTLGHEVEVRAADGSAVRGMALGVGDDGALLLGTPAGQRRIFAGEVFG